MIKHNRSFFFRCTLVKRATIFFFVPFWPYFFHLLGPLFTLSHTTSDGIANLGHSLLPNVSEFIFTDPCTASQAGFFCLDTEPVTRPPLPVIEGVYPMGDVVGQLMMTLVAFEVDGLGNRHSPGQGFREYGETDPRSAIVGQAPEGNLDRRLKDPKHGPEEVVHGCSFSF